MKALKTAAIGASGLLSVAETPKPASGAAGKVDRLLAASRRGSTPPPRISVPDWANTYRKNNGQGAIS